jgi:hypothetical protein
LRSKYYLQILYLSILLHTSEDITTRYGREQKEKGKLQITEELNNGAKENKSRLLQQILGNRYSSE